jgi:N-acetylglucosamine-6-phosphate deacetylase
MNDGEISARHYLTRKPMRLRWSKGVISHLEKADRAPKNLWLAPALFDLQINGYGGIDFQQDNLTEADLLSAMRQLRRAGCARFLLTLITDEWPKLTARLARLKTLRDGSPELKGAISGWHVEGPFLSEQPGFHGAHNPAWMLDPKREHIEKLRNITGTDPLLLTIAPERDGAIDAIGVAKSLGIKISLGHTNASGDVLCQAIAAGAIAFTHLANGCPRDLDRHDNILWRVFDLPNLFVSLIPDQIHVSPQLFKLMHRILGDKIFYTTDAMSAAGAPPGRYTIGNTQLEVGTDQIVRQPGKSNFAGSALRPIDGIFRSAQALDRPWQEIWPRLSTVPSKLIGVSNSINVGDAATFCLLQLNDKNVVEELRVFINGAPDGPCSAQKHLPVEPIG